VVCVSYSKNCDSCLPLFLYFVLFDSLMFTVSPLRVFGGRKEHRRERCRVDFILILFSEKLTLVNFYLLMLFNSKTMDLI